MKKLLFILFLLFLTGCASQFPAQVEGEGEKYSKKCPGVYTVKKGETIFSISLKCGFDYQKVALSNGLKKPYFVKPGDQIRFDLLRKSKPNTHDLKNKDNTTNTIPYNEGEIIEDNIFTSEEITTQDLEVEFQFGDPIQIDQPKVIREVYSKKSIKKSKKLSELKAKNQKKWEWPTNGKLTSPFSEAADKKGIEILGLEGQEIRSTLNGKVIYVGEDLAGYGKLTIIKHNNDILSVYGHQQSILVTEGQAVQAGESIGTMGATGADGVKLLFEIRKDGKSIDPMNFLEEIL